MLFAVVSFCNDLQPFVFTGTFNFLPRKEYSKDQKSDPFGFDIDFKHMWLLIQDLRDVIQDRTGREYDSGLFCTSNVEIFFRATLHDGLQCRACRFNSRSLGKKRDLSLHYFRIISE